MAKLYSRFEFLKLIGGIILLVVISWGLYEVYKSPSGVGSAILGIVHLFAGLYLLDWLGKQLKALATWFEGLLRPKQLAFYKAVLSTLNILIYMGVGVLLYKMHANTPGQAYVILGVIIYLHFTGKSKTFGDHQSTLSQTHAQAFKKNEV